MSAYIRPRLGRVPDHEVGTCTCNGRSHPGVYRAEHVTAATGVVNMAYLCVAKAAGFAARFSIDFPPVLWQPDANNSATKAP